MLRQTGLGGMRSAQWQGDVPETLMNNEKHA